MRTWPGPGSPTGTSSTCSTSGPPCLWKRIALAIRFSPVDGNCLVFLGRVAAGGAHRLQRGAPQPGPLDPELDHVEALVDPGLDPRQVRNPLLHDPRL